MGYRQRGFTLLELLIVIGIIAILATVAIAAINPARQFAQARNTQRLSAIAAIMGAIGQRMVDNRGVFEGGACPSITTATSTIGATFESCLVPTYLPTVPRDPLTGTDGADTGLEISRNQGTGRITICAPKSAEEQYLGLDAYVLCVTR